MVPDHTSSKDNRGFRGTIPRQRIGLGLLVAGPAMLVVALFTASLTLELAGLGIFLGGFIVMLQEEDEALSSSTTASLLNSQLVLLNTFASSDGKKVLLGHLPLAKGTALITARLQGDKLVDRAVVQFPAESDFPNFHSMILTKLPSHFDTTEELLRYLGEAIIEDLHLASTFDFNFSDGLIAIHVGGFRLRDVCTDQNKDTHSSFGCAFCNTLGIILASQTHAMIARLESRYQATSDISSISFRVTPQEGQGFTSDKSLVSP